MLQGLKCTETFGKLRTFERKLAADTVLGLLQPSTEKAIASSLSGSYFVTKQVGYVRLDQIPRSVSLTMC